MDWISIFSRQHLGIIFTIIGTVLLAFSVSTKEQRGIAMEYDKEGNSMALVPMCGDEDPNCEYVYPSQASINKRLFWIGLLFVALGSALQW